MSRFIPVEYLGSEKEVGKICLSTIDTLEREYKIKINQEVIIPAVVNSFIDAAIYVSLQFKNNEGRNELNLFNLLRVVHTLTTNEDNKSDVMTIITLGRMGMRKLEVDFNEEVEESEHVSTKIQDIDIKLLENISMRASQYLEDRHNLAVRDYQVIFKVAEVFFDEMLSYIKLNDVSGESITIFDQFTILIDDFGNFESIEPTESLEENIKLIHENNVADKIRLLIEDGEIDE